jgi:hypothetical protein
MLPADTPKLPKWPFLLGDAALLGLAWLIASQSRSPFAGTPFIAIVSCVALGALLAVVPFLTDYARKQDEALDERQRALDALSRTVAASAEQISIAASGLHEISELAQRNLRGAEQLPEKLQEKIAGLKNQLASTRDGEREELKKELARLRASEGERLQSAADRIAQAVVELTRLEAATQVLLAARPEPVEAAAPSAAPAIPAATQAAGPISGESAPPPKRIRKPRTEEPVIPVESPVVAADSTPSETAAPSSQREEPAPIPTAAIPEIVPVAPDSNPPIETNHRDEPVTALAAAETPAPAAESPKPERKRAPKKPKATPPPPEDATPENPPDPTASPPAPEPAFTLEIENPPTGTMQNLPSDETAPASAVSPDGATRLLVTAYIGIGNRLFIRGAGPGLSWDKGLPLQFVSIGKWRWETSDTTAPVQFKLYKNDDIECAALGTRTLDPGRQQEVTAAF